MPRKSKQKSLFRKFMLLVCGVTPLECGPFRYAKSDNILSAWVKIERVDMPLNVIGS